MPSDIKFSNQEQDAIIRRIQDYFRDALDQDIGQFDAQFVLDFFAREIGPYFYNRGLYDAQVILQLRLEDLSDAILELEKSTQSRG